MAVRKCVILQIYGKRASAHFVQPPEWFALQRWDRRQKSALNSKYKKKYWYPETDKVQNASSLSSSHHGQVIRTRVWFLYSAETICV